MFGADLEKRAGNAVPYGFGLARKPAANHAGLYIELALAARKMKRLNQNGLDGQ